MASRLELQNILEQILGSRNVYYQPPESTKLEYPAIVYSKDSIDKSFADNNGYIHNKSYEIIVIDKKPDNPVIDKILELPLSSFSRHYKSDNLNHDVIKLYF